MLVTTAPAEPVTRPPGDDYTGARHPGDSHTSDTHPGPRQAGHLWQVDVVRLLTFSAVIAVHTLAFTEQPDNRLVAGMMMLLQYGREVFFALTGFVLVYSTWGRPLRLASFWRKRILFVAVPYLAWSVIYYAYAVYGPGHMRPSASAFGWDILYGSAEYHLYFLLVTLQLYLAFPLISRFVRRTAGRAVPVLAAVTVLNLAWMAVVAYVPTPSSGVPAWLFDHAYELLPTYAMYVLAGCYAAVHLDRIQSFVERRSASLLKLAGWSALVAVVVYVAQLPFMAPRTADQVIQPASVFSSLAALIVTYVIGARWAAGRRRRQRTIEVLSDASFGVYLAHPLVLLFLTDYLGFGNNGQKLTPVVATVIAYLVTAVGATVITLAARRTPLSLALSGRPWRAAVKRHAHAEVPAPC